ncbi:hypothetical protein HELRODRAFT_182646 [Helobdella robusta]|uniref:Uncharacterized protein n=1 Tax=Helobdella robusta TaxID=6412 RepID=T1FIJ3_HELRO|nr:hypothetical protein HELRODRAFT_182646 [Helobdella robusta]ESN90812.1 hypothetical protein HELRODRAFT_182646 [Helobdella robusta]
MQKNVLANHIATLLPPLFDVEKGSSAMKSDDKEQFVIPGWIPSLPVPNFKGKVDPPTYEEITAIISGIKSRAFPCPLDQTLCSRNALFSELTFTNYCYCWALFSILNQRILSLIANLNQKYKSIKKNMRKSQEKTLAFREVSEKTLFDISACKCGEDFDNCFCKNKVPKRERDFLTDQRTVRKMIIGNTDKKISQSLQKSLARKAKEEARLSKIEGPCAKKQKCDNLAFDEAVERMIKLVTEASLSVCGEKARDGFIRTKLASQNDIPKFETKKHFII